MQAVLVSIVLHSLWGGNPVAVKFGLLVFPPMWSAFIRFVIGIICIAAWAAFRGIPMWPKKGEWRLLILLGSPVCHTDGHLKYRIRPHQGFNRCDSNFYQSTVRSLRGSLHDRWRSFECS